MDREKFQQKALKQTKQKKSKSAEFLMVKEDRDAAEGIGNPAFNMSSPDLSAYQTSEKNVIRYDMPDLTLAAHQRKLRLLTSAEPKGNEYSRNYFDPLMDEEINPRQYGMEVSREAPLQVDDRILYDQLTKLLDESEQGEPSDGNVKEKTVDPEVPMGSSRSHELHIGAGEDIPSYIEEFEKYAQKDVILRSSSSLEQDLQFEGEGLNQHIPMSNLKTDKAFEKPQSHPLNANLNVCEEDMGARFGNCIEVTNESKGTAGPCWKVEQTQPLQPLQMQIKCLRGIKDKVPQGSYFLKVSLLSRLGSFVLQEWTTEQLKTRTHPIRHDGNFYNVGLYFNENLHLKLPPKKDVKPGMAFLFELFLLHENYACFDRVVGWAAFPLCNNNFDVVEGKFKCPLLRGSYDQKLSNFRTIEDLICLELDHWLCNLYFQVIKLPLHLDDQKHHERRIRLTPEFPPCFLAEAEKAESNLENTTGHSEKETKKSISASMDGHGRSFACFRQGLRCTVLLGSKVMLAHDPFLLQEQRNMWKELFFYISQLVISSAGHPLTPLRDPDTHKGSVPTDVKEVEKQFNTKEGGEEGVSKGSEGQRDEMGLKCFQQVRIFVALFSFPRGDRQFLNLDLVNNI